MASTTDAPISMTTLDSGAIVAVTLTDTETVTPTGEDVSIRFRRQRPGQGAHRRD